MNDIKNSTAGDIQKDLYDAYSGNLRNAVNGVYPIGDNADLFCANVSRFAAYKSYHATQKLKEHFANNPKTFDKLGKAILNTYNRYQAAEYNTTVARCRTAKQFESFMQEDNKFLFPNLRWLPSSSANPREAHKKFWWMVLPKTDPFWDQNRPGNIWNCKCDLEETDAPIDTKGNDTTKSFAANGLEGNPSKTGEIFSDECKYIKKSGKKVEEKCESVNQKNTSIIAKQSLLKAATKCTILEKEYIVEFDTIGIDHYTKDLFGKKELFWVKNAIATNISQYIKTSKCIGRKVSDSTHNTNKKTKRRKEQTSYFYYFPITLPNKKQAYLHLGMFNAKKEGKEGIMYLYSITENIPKNIEVL